MMKHKDIVVRSAHKDDLNELLRLYAHLNPEDADLLPPRSELAGRWTEMVANPMVTTIVAECEDRLAASCSLTVVPNLTRGARPFGVIENVITHPDFRRRGLASAVIERAIETAQQADCYKVMLLSSISRTGAHALYEKLGFRRDTKVGFDLRLEESS